jgi:hypothetical protein
MSLQNSAYDGQSIVVRRLEEKFGWKSGSLPYDSARLGLPTHIFKIGIITTGKGGYV